MNVTASDLSAPTALLPRKNATPFAGGSLYTRTRFMRDSIAHITFLRVVRLLMFELWAYSFRRYPITSEICLPGDTYSEISSVARPRHAAISSSLRLKAYRWRSASITGAVGGVMPSLPRD